MIDAAASVVVNISALPSRFDSREQVCAPTLCVNGHGRGFGGQWQFERLRSSSKQNYGTGAA